MSLEASPRTEPDDEPARPLTADVVRVLAENHARFLAFLERRTGSRDTAEELLQDAFVRGIDKASALRHGESAVAWFYRLLRNAIVDHHRRRGAERRALATMSAAPEPVAEGPDEELMQAVCGCVGSLLETMKPDYAEALRRVDLEGDSVTTFAAAEGISNNNASVRLHRARQALRVQVERSCGTCCRHGCFDCTCKAR
jgi:RNA polymerase sigma-70 factor (ECF subfamily)